MPRATIRYKADQEVFGRHLRSNEWILYTGTLTIYERKTYPVVLKLKSEVYDSFLSELLEDKKQFKGDSVSEVYGKVSKWYYSSGIILKN
jgi:hypothetical protein